MKIVILLFVYHLANGDALPVGYVQPSMRVCVAALKVARAEFPKADIECKIKADIKEIPKRKEVS